MNSPYRDDGVGRFEIYKHGHNAGDIHTVRIGRERVQVTQATVTLAVLCQPTILEDIRGNKQFRGEGLLARFVYALPTSTVGRRNIRPVGVAPDVTNGYALHLSALLELVPASDEHGNPAPHVMALSKEALGALEKFEEELEPRLDPHGDLGSVADWGGKLAGLTVRLAGIFTLAGRAGDLEPWRDPVPEDAMNKAITIVRDFVTPHGIAALSLAGADPTADWAEKAVRVIQERGLTTFTQKRLFDLVRVKGFSAQDLGPVLALLEENGYVRYLGKRMPKGERGGRPSETYEVNPALHAWRAAS